jgi:2',3'-cyclic-nucleotide 2'-phosphodiesterase (5'-nucleotidase family)
MSGAGGLALGLAVLLAGCAAGAPDCRDETPARVRLLLVNDVYRLEPGPDGRGGLARLATLVRRLRAETPRTLFVLAGDTLAPSALSAFFRGQQMIEAWNALGLDAATFGNHEFDFGPAELRRRMAESRFPWLSSNVREAGGRPFGGAVPALRRDLDGVRVGLAGLTATETATTSNPGPDVSFAPPVPAAREALAGLGRLDVRVAVTHLHLAEDRALAAALPLDAILGGHDHDPMIHTVGATVIVKAGADAVNLGEVELLVVCGRVRERRPRLHPVDASLAAAPDVLALVERWAARAEGELAAPVASLRRPIDARDSELRRRAMPLGRFLAEAVRERLGADAALLNAGAIRANRVFPAGPLTGRDLLEMLPFGNVIVLLELPGSRLLAALERGLARLPGPSAAYLQTAGLALSVDPTRPPGRRVAGLRVGGRPLDPARSYRVAVIDFLARGGDGYAELAGARVLRSAEEGPGLLETALAALRRGASP